MALGPHVGSGGWPEEEPPTAPSIPAPVVQPRRALPTARLLDLGQ